MRRRVKKAGAPADPAAAAAPVAAAHAAQAAPATTKKRMLDLGDDDAPSSSSLLPRAPPPRGAGASSGKRGAAAAASDAGRHGAKSGGDDVLHVNEAFAKRFEHNKRREEMHRLMERHGGELTDSDASTSESEDDEAMLLTDKVEQQVLETISAIRRRDPAIYDSQKTFFANPDELPDDELALDRGKASDAGSRGKPLTLKDYEREAILKHGGLPDSSDSEDDAQQKKARPLTHVEEQRQLKESFLRAAAAGADDDLLTVRKKSRAEAERESREFAEWSKKHGPSTAAGEDILAKAFGDETALDEKDRFLRDYIMGRAWVDDDGTGSRVPTYKEIVGDVGQSTDEEELENMDEYENKFNFRFEEGDAGAIQTYARDVPGSVRRKDDSRKKKREEKRTREEEAARRNKEEIRRLKSLKKQELDRRMQQLQQVSGASSDAVQRLFEEAEEDFDQDKFDQRMQSLFDEHYYGDSVDDRKKPSVEDDDVLRQLLEEPDPYASEEDSDGESPAPAAAAAAASAASASASSSAERKGDAGSTKASKAAKRGEVQKSKTEVKRLLREYNELYYDEKTGSVADRFPYVQVKPNNFGWSLRDILELDDKDLNSRVSVKKLAPYREDEFKPRSRALHWKTVRHRELHGGKHAPKADDEQQNANDDDEPLTAVDEHGTDAAAAAGAAGGVPDGDEQKRKRRHRSKKRGAVAPAQ